MKKTKPIVLDKKGFKIWQTAYRSGFQGGYTHGYMVGTRERLQAECPACRVENKARRVQGKLLKDGRQVYIKETS